MFSNYLNKTLTNNDITQSQLAHGLGVSRAAICYWTQGKRTPNYLLLSKLVNFLDKKTPIKKNTLILQIMNSIFADQKKAVQ